MFILWKNAGWWHRGKGNLLYFAILLSGCHIDILNVYLIFIFFSFCLTELIYTDIVEHQNYFAIFYTSSSSLFTSALLTKKKYENSIKKYDFYSRHSNTKNYSSTAQNSTKIELFYNFFLFWLCWWKNRFFLEIFDLNKLFCFM